jgi:hypothetical protein
MEAVMEHRWGNRIAIDVPVRLSAAGLAGTGILRNLSASGAFVETALPLAPLTRVRVQIPRGSVPGLGRADAWGFVVRQATPGVGIEWCDVAPLRAEELSRQTELLQLPASRGYGTHKAAQR